MQVIPYALLEVARLMCILSCIHLDAHQHLIHPHNFHERMNSTSATVRYAAAQLDVHVAKVKEASV